MKNLIARYFIHRSLDDGRDPPAWVRRAAERDPRLARFIREQNDVIDRLRADADDWAARASEMTALPSRRPRRLSASAIPTVAAIAACAVAAFIIASTPAPLVISETGVTQAEPFELEDVKGAVEDATRTADKVATQFEELSVVVRQPKKLGDLTTRYVEQAGSVFGQGLSLLTP